MNIIELPKTPKAKSIDYALFIAHLILLVLLVSCAKTFPIYDTNYDTVFKLLGFAYPFILGGMYSKQLRNNRIFFSWLLLSTLQFTFSNYFTEMNEYGDNILYPIRGLFFTLISIRFCHSLSFIFYKFPYIATSKANLVGDWDYSDNRMLQRSDFIFTIISIMMGVVSVIS